MKADELRWFYHAYDTQGGHVSGPVGLAEIREAYSRGDLKNDDLVWHTDNKQPMVALKDSVLFGYVKGEKAVEEIMVEAVPPRHPGIRIIAAYFILDGLYSLYYLVPIWLYGRHAGYPLIYNAFPICYLAAGIGLWLKKGWGLNFGLASSLIFVYAGVFSLLAYYLRHDTGDLVGGAFAFLLAISIGSYLYQRPIRKLFPESPVSLSVIGFTLTIYGVTQHSGSALVDWVWVGLSIVGTAVGLRAAKQLRRGLSTSPHA